MGACTFQTWAQKNPYEIHVLKRNKNGVTTLDVHPDGSRILIGTSDYTVKSWNFVEDRIEFEIPMSREVFSVKYLPDGSYFFANAGPDILVYSGSGDYFNVLKGHNTATWSMDTDPTGTYLVSGSFSKEFIVWDIPQLDRIETVKDHDKSVLAVCFSPDGQHIASGSLDRTIRIRKFPSLEFEVSAIAHTENIYDLEYRPDGHLLASASRDGTIKIWDVKSGEVSLVLKGHNGSVFSMSFSPDGVFLVSGSEDHTIKLWEVHNGQLVYTFTGHEGPVNAVRFLTDGTGFVSGSMDETVRVWEINPEIVVHHCCKTAFDEEIDTYELFEPRREGESGADYKKRLEDQEIQKAALYQKYYNLYLQRLKEQ